MRRVRRQEALTVARHVVRPTTARGAMTAVRAVVVIAAIAAAPQATARAQARRPAAVSSTAAAPVATLPTGWKARLDPQEEKAGRTLADVKVEGDSAALHVTGGPAATLWNPADTASAAFTVWGSFTQRRASTPPGSYGPFIGGTSLDGKEYNYLYCAVFGSGVFSVKHRFGGELHTLVERKASGAIRRADASGKASNAISWSVDQSNVSCLINGTAVATFPRALVIGPGKLESTDGIFGIHVDRDVDVRIAEFGRRRR